MITVHSNDGWIDAFLPKLFKLRSVRELTNTSRGTLAALSSYDGFIDSDQVHSLCDRYQHVIVYVCDPFANSLSNQRVLEGCLRNCPHNVMFFTDVILDDRPANHQHIANWFMIHRNLYADCCWAADLLAELRDNIRRKTYCFDALLGVRRPHREFIYSSWQQSKFQNQVLLTYHGNDARRGIWHVPYVAEPCENVDMAQSGALAVTLWTNMPQPDGALTYRVGSQNLVPVGIYNDCWYSIIAEGFLDTRGTRLTEKTAKVLVGERLFVYFGAPHDLERMRRLGFETFGHVVDESYDRILDNTARWQAAWQQVEWLCQQDPHQVLAATRSRREHNRQVFLHTDWYANLRNHLRKLCAKY